MLTKLIIAGSLLTALGAFRPPEIADSVGWRTLRNSAVTAFQLPR